MGKKIWDFTALTDDELDESADLLGARERMTKKVPVSLILNRIKVVSDRIGELSNRVNTIITGGSSTKDAELVDIRTGVDDTIYDTAGDAVRAAQMMSGENSVQISNIENQIGDGQWKSATLVNGATGNSWLGDGSVKYRVSNGICQLVGIIDVNHQKDNTTYIQGLPKAKRVSYHFAPTSGTKIARLNVGRAGILNIEWIVNISDGSAYKGSTWIDISTTYEVEE